MPLPPALAARLAKRGIVKDTPKPPPPPVKEAKKNEDEEVFAEDYDDMRKPDPPQIMEEYTIPEPVEKPFIQVEEEEEDYDPNEPIITEVINCPFKINPYHECTDYCKNTYGLKPFEPESKMLKLRERMLRKYPLPDNWREVADPLSNRYYYWNMMSDQVCWLSPLHPRATVTLPAERLRGLLDDKDNLSDQEDDEKMEEGSDLSDDDSMSGSDSEEDVIMPDKNNKKKSQDYGRQNRDDDRGRGRGRKGGRKQRDELDPMDPASYSEAPRGTWSSGLDQRGSAKTGVDATASGPLFQQRPYPSPGAVLRANRQMEDDK
ncbi:hypothetical protein SNE40_014562 [Patella caerulea]|uniref:Polyglutamine-binding protein 1 n=1 Tax=Patella caerulea TaxID=87958 RepID=A0AAN8JH58_PATCE